METVMDKHKALPIREARAAGVGVSVELEVVRGWVRGRLWGVKVWKESHLLYLHSML